MGAPSEIINIMIGTIVFFMALGGIVPSLADRIERKRALKAEAAAAGSSAAQAGTADAKAAGASEASAAPADGSAKPNDSTSARTVPHRDEASGKEDDDA